jgi:hypothetical protein
MSMHLQLQAGQSQEDRTSAKLQTFGSSVTKLAKVLTKAVVSVLIFLLTVARHGSSSRSYNAIYNFGDSISDTGNLCTGGCPLWLTNGRPHLLGPPDRSLLRRSHHR